MRGAPACRPRFPGIRRTRVRVPALNTRWGPLVLSNMPQRLLRPYLHFGLLSALAAGHLSAQEVGGLRTARDSAVHLLDRIGYGAAPGQVDAVIRTGILRWIDQQLAYPAAGDPGLATIPQALPVLARSRKDLVQEFTRMRQAQAAERRTMTVDSASATRPPAGAGARAFRAGMEQVQQAVILRGIRADNQLGEVLADFWFNHFNVFAGKALLPALLPEYVEHTIRPHVLDRFETLLLAVARSPAMLVYLDNAQSVAPGSTPPQLARLERIPRDRMRTSQRARLDSARRQVQERLPTGLNENYARELLELHTLGVDGGYTQNDVIAVARILAGWSIARPADGAGFVFNAWAHDRGSKTVLGQVVPAGAGVEEGDALLQFLARHPATIRHVSRQLCARFVADIPPDGCVDDAVRAWQQTDGDLRAVVRAILRSPDFWAPAAVAAKVKTPLEFLVSAVRAVGGVPDTSPGLARAVARLGQPLYQQAIPTGYPESQEEWVNSGALLARMNVAMALAAGTLPGVTVDLDETIPLTADHEALIDRIDTVLLGGRMSANTRAVLLREIADVPSPTSARTLAVGLALGGPEFQRQ